MAENIEGGDYLKTLTEALNARAEWLERSELPKLKEELRIYHTGFSSLYHVYLRKGLIREDPYKAEAKIGELEVPSTAPFPDAERFEQLTQRLANYDNQLDFLVNFYQFSPEFLNLDRIKRILGLMKYIDWIHLSPDSQDHVNKAIAEMTNQVKIGSDSLTMSVIGESLTNLNKSYPAIMGRLKTLTDYQKEAYKLSLRDITAGMSAADAANFPQLKKKLVQAKPGLRFYTELAEEVLKEDYSGEGPGLREAVLKKLEVAENKPKAIKVQVSYKDTLVEGIQGLGGTAATFAEIAAKLDENQTLLENKQKTLMQKLKKLFQMAFNKKPEPTVYELEYIDPIKGTPVQERINFGVFRGELERKIRTLAPTASRGAAAEKLKSMQEEQLLGFLERNIRDVQSLHKILGALDDFFKAGVDRADREKIKGIKPELGTIKNAIVRANSKRHEYSAQKEEEEQLRKLGVKPEA